MTIIPSSRAFIFFLISAATLSCKPKEETTLHANGKIKERYQVNKKNEKNGTYEAFHDNGKPSEISTYRNGKISGTKLVYRYDGSLDTKETYDQNGQLDGPYLVYHPNGKIQVEKTYVSNAIQGMLKVYYPNGKIKEEVNIEDNEENGPFTEYYLNGAIHWKGQYRHGDNEFGDLTEYDSLGNVIKKMLCDTQGICRTVWKPGMPNLPLTK
jgi:antitoxin component YwqK of YwqJK toxin-antitoxin module